MPLLTTRGDSDMLTSKSTEIIHCQNGGQALNEGRSQQQEHSQIRVIGQKEHSCATPEHHAATFNTMPTHNNRVAQKRADSMSVATDITSRFHTGACSCNCNCAGCVCKGETSGNNKRLGYELDDFVVVGSGCSEHEFPQGEEGAEGYPPAFPWRSHGVGEHIDNLFGGFEITKEGFQHLESDECEPLRQSVILRDLTSFNRTAGATSLVNEATSGVASMTSSGFLPRAPEQAQNLLDFVGSWDEISPTGPGYHFAGQPLWLSPSSWSQRHDSGQLDYPQNIRDEDMK